MFLAYYQLIIRLFTSQLGGNTFSIFYNGGTIYEKGLEMVVGRSRF